MKNIVFFKINLAIICLMLLTGAGVTSATTYYVSPYGNDSNDGLSLDAAWATIQHAADTIGPGDTVLVQSGTYNEQVTITTSGTSGNPITFKGEGMPVVNANGGNGFTVRGSYITITGFKIENFNKGIYVPSQTPYPEHLTFSYNNISWPTNSVGIAVYYNLKYSNIIYNEIHTYAQAISLYSSSSEPGFFYCNISHNNLSSISDGAGVLARDGSMAAGGPATGGLPAGYNGWAMYCNFINNTIRNGRNGFSGGGLYGCNISYNDIAGYYHNGLNLHSTQYSTIIGNVIDFGDPAGDALNAIYCDGSTAWWHDNYFKDNRVINTYNRAISAHNCKNAIVENLIVENAPSADSIYLTYGGYKYQEVGGNWTVRNSKLKAGIGRGLVLNSQKEGHFYVIDTEIEENPTFGAFGYDSNNYQPTVTMHIINVDSDDCRYVGSTSGGEYRVYYYLDIQVVDATGNPVQGAIVKVTNANDPSYPPISLATTYAAPPTTITETSTGSDGHTPLPNNKSGTIAIMDYLKTASGTTYYTYNITAEKDGYSNSTTVNPDSSWYRSDPNTYQNTVTIVLPIANQRGDLNNNGKIGDSEDLILMWQGFRGIHETDWRYDLNQDGKEASIADVLMMWFIWQIKTDIALFPFIP